MNTSVGGALICSFTIASPTSCVFLSEAAQAQGIFRTEKHQAASPPREWQQQDRSSLPYEVGPVGYPRRGRITPSKACTSASGIS